MASDDKIGRVPQALRARVDEIVALVETVCVEHLDQEYAMLCRRLVAKLACGLNGSMHHCGRVKIVIASGPPTPVEEWATACRVAPVEV